MKWKYFFLTLALAEFALGFSNARPDVLFYLALPLGVVLFLICAVLELESALFVEPPRAELLVRSTARPTCISHPKGTTNPALTSSRFP